MGTVRGVLTCFLFGTLISVSRVRTADIQVLSTEDLLFKKLKEARSGTLARPVLNASEAVEANVTASLLQILELDAKQQSISISVYFDVEWFEPRFRWDPLEYDGLTKVVVSAKDLWVPDIGLVNSLDGNFDFAKEREFRILLESNGRVLWYPGGILRVACPLDMTYFPFDTQTCTFLFTSWSYDARALLLRAKYSTVMIVRMVSQTEWGIRNRSIYSDVRSDSDSPDLPDYSYLFMQLTTVRDPQFYIINLFIPALIITFLVLTVFFLPCESGEKVSLGVTILLAFTVFQLVIAESLPPNTTTIPIVVIYLAVLMSTTAISTVASVFVLNIYHMESSDKLPSCVRFFIYDVIARIICYKTHHRLRDDRKSALSEDNTTELTYVQANNISNADKDDEANSSPLVGTLEREEEGDKMAEVIHLLQEINSSMKANQRKRHDHNRETAIQNEWREAANVIDRFLMLLYFIAIAFVMITFYVVVHERNDNHGYF